MLLICLYWGLDAPKRDLTYIFTSLAISQRPVSSLYKKSLRVMRELLNGAVANITAVFLTFKSL